MIHVTRPETLTSQPEQHALKRVLAADIGGTNSRFCFVETDGCHTINMGPTFTMSTRQPGVSSFEQYWSLVQQSAPAGFFRTGNVDAIALAVAGTVSGQSALLPNIDWNIEPGDLPSEPPLFLINDFTAQGYALLVKSERNNLSLIRGGSPAADGSTAVVGAGTGLGHCVLHPTEEAGLVAPKEGNPGTHRLIFGSESGHAVFPFQGEEEMALAKRWIKLAGKPWLSNDDVVSGPGAASLNQCLSGKNETAAEILSREDTDIVSWFSRFYARACRNYCLAVFPVKELVISGGIAAKNPHLVSSKDFTESFNDAGDYSPLFENISILLNMNQSLGLRGAAVYAARQFSP